jgi:hypothetical protein
MYRVEILGVDGKAADEKHEQARFDEAGLYVRDGARETVVPWHTVRAVSITELETGVRRPERREAPPVVRSRGRRR